MPLVVRTELIGSGTDKDPYRANYPHYTTVSVDYESKEIIIEIPDHTYPSEILLPDYATGSKQVEIEHQGAVHGKSLESYHAKYPIITKDHQRAYAVTSVSPAAMRLWHQHLDDMYREHEGEFRHKVI